MTTSTGGELLVTSLIAHGVECVWGIPGTHNLAIYSALSDSPIRHILPRHEQGAGFAADGYARSSGRPGVLITTSGPGSLNAMTAMAQAYSDSIPVLHISAGMPVRHPGQGNGFLHETKRLQPPVGEVSAYSHRITSLEEIPYAVATAFARMSSGRARPVHLELPFDLLDELGSVDSVSSIMTSVGQPDRRAISSVADKLSRSRRPLILAGGGAVGCGEALVALAEMIEAPVVTSINGKGVIAESDRHAMGAGLDRDPVHAIVSDSDLVLVVGCELAPSDLWLEPLPLSNKVVRIDVDPRQVLTNVEPLVSIVGDAGLALHALTDEPCLARLASEPKSSEQWARTEQWRQRFSDDADARSQPWRGVLVAIDDALHGRGVIAGDSAMVCYYGATPALSREVPRSYLYPTGLGTLGYALPAAVGASFARRGERVVALMGDGGVMFTLPELAMAAECRLPLPVVIVDNGGYGEIRNEMHDRGDAELAVDMEPVDFAAVGRAMGCSAHRVDDLDRLPELLETAFNADRPTVLHVREDQK